MDLLRLSIEIVLAFEGAGQVHQGSPGTPTAAKQCCYGAIPHHNAGLVSMSVSVM
jgi:hypothetical protein